MVLFFFFFQAEDGIRDVERSRGLGDVYKRQVSTQSTWDLKEMEEIPIFSENETEKDQEELANFDVKNSEPAQKKKKIWKAYSVLVQEWQANFYRGPRLSVLRGPQCISYTFRSCMHIFYDLALLQVGRTGSHSSPIGADDQLFLSLLSKSRNTKSESGAI
eukprot:TRINITY_DN44767_c0_g2_i1.p2 TRINITY_DN44767_c0_g2~~TRINITY_DN44767_c0_g2_i1.p2  ORF type:complete len:161 (-),score=36.54 TRINITY_DN44767_c0_g2_i1:341-823(-)